MKFTLHQLQRRGLDTFAPVEIECTATGSVDPYTLSENEEWRLTATIAVNFWANRAQLPRARETALKAVLLHIHEVTLRMLPHIRLAVSDGSKERTLKLLDQLESSIRDYEPTDSEARR